MFSFIDDIPSLDQIRARVRDDLRKYGWEKRWNDSRLVQKSRELLNDEELKIDPVTWIWKRLPTKEEVAARRQRDFETVWKYRYQAGGFAAGALLALSLAGIFSTGNFGGSSDANNRPTVIYPIE
ncbi:MFS transporter [Cereibacter sediminicola]|uniref:MFS transporter n=1 Tax=Cereibacter sediminicola TaxID=2584941 RepID=UPI0011A24F54|nr:MFS transporter [Cereibacter sediminicola]